MRLPPYGANYLCRLTRVSMPLGELHIWILHNGLQSISINETGLARDPTTALRCTSGSMIMRH